MIDVSIAGNENERLVLAFIRSMELGTVAEFVENHCADDFTWANSGLTTIEGKAHWQAQAAAGGFASEIPIIRDMTHFSAELLHMASEGDVVFTERVDHHWDASGRDLMTPHICGIAEVKEGQIVAFRDFYDVACYNQAPTEADPEFVLERFRERQAAGEA